MKIAKDKVVSIDYKLSDSDNQVVDSSEDGGPLSYLHGNGNLVPGLERALEGKGPGESIQVSIPPEDGYGVRDDSKVGQVPRSELADVGEIELGMQFEATTPDGDTTVVTVVWDPLESTCRHASLSIL